MRMYVLKKMKFDYHNMIPNMTLPSAPSEENR